MNKFEKFFFVVLIFFSSQVPFSSNARIQFNSVQFKHANFRQRYWMLRLLQLKNNNVKRWNLSLGIYLTRIIERQKFQPLNYRLVKTYFRKEKKRKER